MRFEARASHEAGYRAATPYEDWSDDHKGRPHPYLVKLRDWGIDGVAFPDPPQMLLLMRYEGAINRDLYRAMGELRKVRKERESFDRSADHMDASPEKPGASNEQNYQTNPNPPPVNAGDGLESRIEGESPPNSASPG